VKPRNAPRRAFDAGCLGSSCGASDDALVVRSKASANGVSVTFPGTPVRSVAASAAWPSPPPSPTVSSPSRSEKRHGDADDDGVLGVGFGLLGGAIGKLATTSKDDKRVARAVYGCCSLC
jgi:hypothetical protein